MTPLPSIAIDSGWSDLVFHVLAHVDLRGVAPNVFDARYARWVAAQRRRDGGLLAADASLLAALLAEPADAAGVQALAVLFTSTEQAMASARCELRELSADDVGSPAALRALASVTELAEHLRSSALLEAETHAELPEARTDRSQLNAALERVAHCAPALRECELVLCRALTRHGRVFGARVHVGLPDAELGVSAQQVAMQAAHEASVLEAGRALRGLGLQLNERAVEALAVVLFAQRCARGGLVPAHAAWGAQWGVRPEHCELAAVPEPARELATELLRS